MNRVKATRLERSLLGASITTIFLTFAIPCARAQTQWNGGTGNWNVAGNWTPSKVPNSATTSVAISGTAGTPSSVTLSNLSVTIQNLSLDSFSTLSITGYYPLFVEGPTIANGGQINVGTASIGSTLYVGSGTTLSGSGAVNLINNNSMIEVSPTSGTLVNQSTIQGQGDVYSANLTNQGTINANVSSGGLLVSTTGITNTGTLEATGGGSLYLYNSVTNTNGTIYAGSSSSVYLAGTITGGNLSSVGSGEIIGQNLNTLQGVTITQGSTYSIYSNSSNELSGNLVNQGTIMVGTGGFLLETPTVTLSGGGTINLGGGSISGLVFTEGLVNQDNTIQGQGTIGYLSSFVNGGTVNANVSGGTLIIESAPTTNNGTFQVAQGSTLQTLNTTFTNNGTVNIGSLGDTSRSLFQLTTSNNTPYVDYVQTGGTTNLWSSHSTLEVDGGRSVDIEAGLLQGFGTVQGNLSNSGTVHPGDGPGLLTVKGSYTENASGILDIAIGGMTQGSQYSELSVSGGAALSGTLDVSLLNGFTPAVGETFMILTSTGLSGMFSDNMIQVGNVTFDVEYGPAGYRNDVVLIVAEVSVAVPEPGSLVLLAVGVAGVGVYVGRCGGKIDRS
jgi:hypothetical protein